MKYEWYITILNDPEGFWKLLGNYLTAPFTGNSTDTAILSEFLNTLRNHSLWFLVIVLFVLLLGGSISILHQQLLEREECDRIWTTQD